MFNVSSSTNIVLNNTNIGIINDAESTPRVYVMQ